MSTLPPLPQSIQSAKRVVVNAFQKGGLDSRIDALTLLDVEIEAYGQACADQALEAAAKACEAEHLEDPQDKQDDAYDQGVYDCIHAVLALKGKP